MALILDNNRTVVARSGRFDLPGVTAVVRTVDCDLASLRAEAALNCHVRKWVFICPPRLQGNLLSRPRRILYSNVIEYCLRGSSRTRQTPLDSVVLIA